MSVYRFAYTTPHGTKSRIPSVTLSFEVEPDSEPPTNIHVLIGRNGVGKTTLLHQMARALVEEGAAANDVGRFETADDLEDEGAFANLVSVTFSAFDPFEPLSSPRNKSRGMQYAYVGLKRIRTASNDKPLAPKSPATLAVEFSKSVKICLQGQGLVAGDARWKR